TSSAAGIATSAVPHVDTGAAAAGAEMAPTLATESATSTTAMVAVALRAVRRTDDPLPRPECGRKGIGRARAALHRSAGGVGEELGERRMHQERVDDVVDSQ